MLLQAFRLRSFKDAYSIGRHDKITSYPAHSLNDKYEDEVLKSYYKMLVSKNIAVR